MHGEQEETEQSRKDHRRECFLIIEECAEQQHSELIMEQTNSDSLGEQHKKCLDKIGRASCRERV